VATNTKLPDTRITSSDERTTTASSTTPEATVSAKTPTGEQPSAATIASGVSARIDARRRRGRPIVVNLRGSRRRRRGGKRYTRGFRDLQRVTYGGSRAAYRLMNGVAAGFDSFQRRSSRSARRRRDGLLRDGLRNAARAFSRAARQVGRAPYEIAREISTRRYWKAARNSRGLLPPLPFFVR
jgi:hypothetical protein